MFRQENLECLFIVTSNLFLMDLLLDVIPGSRVKLAA